MHSFNYREHYTIDAEEFDYFEERTGASLHDERRLREYIISLVPPEAEIILDLGCGSAWAAEKLLQKNKQVISLDISVTNPKKALTKFPSIKHKALAADTFYLPLQNNSVDSIIASEIIEHLLHPEKLIEEAMRVLKSGGKLIVSTPYKEKLRYVLCIHCNNKTPVHSHIQSFDEHRLTKLYEENDLKEFGKFIFGNKILIFFYTYPLLKFFPFSIWKLIDKAANLIINKPVHIIATYQKN